MNRPDYEHHSDEEISDMPRHAAPTETVEELRRQRDEYKEAAYRLENTIRLLRAEVAPSRSPAEPPECGICGAKPGERGHGADALGNVHHVPGAGAAGTSEREALIELREKLAKALWDAEIAEELRKGNPNKSWAQWPEDAAWQPYCRSTYRLADALVAVVREFNEPFRQKMIDVARQADEAMQARAAVPQAPALDDLVIDICRETYDRFVMGGWEPQDAHEMIREMLQARAAQAPAEGKPK
jgi:hypothetical protein